jgi:hypothetical protein
VLSIAAHTKQKQEMILLMPGFSEDESAED